MANMRRSLKAVGVFGVLAASFALAGCGASGGLFGGGPQTTAPASASGAPQTQSAASPLGNALFGEPVPPGAPAQSLQTGVCPRVEIRDGSNLWRQGGEGPTELRYQATITDLARECRIDGQTMIVKVGVEGRVLVGPAGGAGRIVLPIRIAVTRGLSQAVWTRFYQVPIEIPANAPNVAFTQIEEAVSFPLPSVQDLREHVIFVGFDLQAQQPPQRGRGRQAQQR